MSERAAFDRALEEIRAVEAADRERYLEAERARTRERETRELAREIMLMLHARYRPDAAELEEWLVKRLMRNE